MNYEKKKVDATFEGGVPGEIELSYPIKEKSKVYIVGCATSKDIVPWNDPDAEYWGVNNLYGVPLVGAHYDRWFEIHNIWANDKNQLLRRGKPEFREQPVEKYMDGLGKIGCTVYMQKHWPNVIPLSIPYPINDVVNFFAGKGLDISLCRYLTNTISYEIVLAIYLGFQEIQIWGVDMSVGSEYENQRPSCEYWAGVASGMGIKVFVPAQADLLKTRFMYGFEEKQQDVFHDKMEKIRVDLKVKRLKLEQELRAADAAIAQYKGGEQVLEDIRKLWANLGDDLLFQKRGTL